MKHFWFKKYETMSKSVIVCPFSKYGHSNGKQAFLKYKDNHEKREPWHIKYLENNPSFLFYFLTEHTLKHVLSWSAKQSVAQQNSLSRGLKPDLIRSKVNWTWIKNICEQNKDTPKDWLFKHFCIREVWIIYDYNVLFLFFMKTLISREWEGPFLI